MGSSIDINYIWEDLSMVSTMRKRVERVNTGTVSKVDNVMRELETNSEFTDYITKNYKRLVDEVPKFGIDSEYSADLIHDVWRSYKIDEANGDCYDMCKGNREGYISLEQSIYGRIKRYSQNKRYQKATESARFNKTTGKYEMKEIASSFNNEELTELSGCQKQYALMNSYDDLGAVEDKEVLAENIQYLLSFGEKPGLPVLNVIETIIKMRSNLQSIDMSIFKGFREADREFREAFTSVYKTAVQAPEYFAAELIKAKAEMGKILEISK